MSPNTGANGRKRCQRCNDNHLLRMFPVSKSSSDGRHPLCFVCRSEVNGQRWPRKSRCGDVMSTGLSAISSGACFELGPASTKAELVLQFIIEDAIVVLVMLRLG